MRALVIKDGVVINAIVVDSLDSFPDLNLIDGENGGGIGDTWDGTTLTPQAVEPPPHDPSYVPPDPKPPTAEERIRLGI
jgi:hypothetical protein